MPTCSHADYTIRTRMHIAPCDLMVTGTRPFQKNIQYRRVPLYLHALQLTLTNASGFNHLGIIEYVCIQTVKLAHTITPALLP